MRRDAHQSQRSSTSYSRGTEEVPVFSIPVLRYESGEYNQRLWIVLLTGSIFRPSSFGRTPDLGLQGKPLFIRSYLIEPLPVSLKCFRSLPREVFITKPEAKEVAPEKQDMNFKARKQLLTRKRSSRSFGVVNKCIPGMEYA